MTRHIYILSCEKTGGIYHYLFNDGSFEFLDKTPLDRPMYAVIRGDKMYVILREIDTQSHFGGIVSFDIDKDGKLINPTDIESTDGIVPCHLEVTDNGAFVVNYLSGNIVKIGKKTVTHSGKGINPARQEAPHTHFVSLLPDKNELACVDLGVDKIYFYDTDLNQNGFVKLPDGCGPRHLCFDKEYIYCVTELSNEVFVIKNGEVIAKSSAEYTCGSAAAAIRKNGDYIYISDRGADTISRFEIEGDSLTFLESPACGESFPRDFDIVGDYIICTNEKGNSVTVLKLQDGKPILTDKKLSIGAPLCIVMKEEL